MERPDSVIKHFEIPDFTFQDGTTLPAVQLAYLDLNPAASKVAVVSTCFRGRLHSTQTFANGALRNHRIIVVGLFGNGESSSPSNMSGFPKAVDYRDCVHAQHELLTKHLNVGSIDVVMGFSMGGQNAYYWAVMYPDMVKHAAIICSSARTSGHNYQFLEGPSAALENSCDFETGKSTAPRGIMAFSKAYSAWLTSAEWFDQERYKDLGYETLSDWDTTLTGSNDEGWHPDDLLVMLRMWQKGNISVCRGDAKGDANVSLEQTLSSIRARILLMPSRTDQYFRFEASAREVQHLKNAVLEVIPSVWGHMAGGGINPLDNAWMDEKLVSLLES
ncbi:putative Alpha/beta-hydrolase [Seiridium unicorne]|uniref:Alpha/beta-hydrolase n=1 Tax=Seiridium unicorne TaxID=138068 RepID=A0ABR2UIU4_9PEZI